MIGTFHLEECTDHFSGAEREQVSSKRKKNRLFDCLYKADEKYCFRCYYSSFEKSDCDCQVPIGSEKNMMMDKNSNRIGKTIHDTYEKQVMAVAQTSHERKQQFRGNRDQEG
jgi:hypothetical protein